MIVDRLIKQSILLMKIWYWTLWCLHSKRAYVRTDLKKKHPEIVGCIKQSNFNVTSSYLFTHYVYLCNYNV